jgi:hypothetical protein
MTGEVLEVDEPSVLVGVDSPTTLSRSVGRSQNNMVEPTDLKSNRSARLSGELVSLDACDHYAAMSD